mmetsp:Transcript_3367/g.7348  ORF Transcript_3367/g.7348 Transcript_3367/m.7348 type:complete len:107 (-) Transcript_3367:635-955(-)
MNGAGRAGPQSELVLRGAHRDGPVAEVAGAAVVVSSSSSSSSAKKKSCDTTQPGTNETAGAGNHPGSKATMPTKQPTKRVHRWKRSARQRKQGDPRRRWCQNHNYG